MNLETDLSLPGTPQDVFDTLVDARRAAGAVPGVRLTPPSGAPLAEQLEGPGVGAELRLQAGGTQITYRGRVLPGTADRAAGILGCRIEAREARGDGVLRGDVGVRLDPGGEGTLMHVGADLEITGRAERLGEDRLRAATLRLLQRMATGLAEAATEPASGPEPDPDALPLVTLPAVLLSGAEPQAEIPGRVRLMTAEPLPLSTLPVSGGHLDDLRVELRRRPWAVALALVAVAAILLALRRRGSGGD
jgi:carbon monoxide dehydrogenase subunit G